MNALRLCCSTIALWWSASTLATTPMPEPSLRVATKEGRIEIVSNRADLISGGDALVSVETPTGIVHSSVTIDLNGKDISSKFSLRENGLYMGLIDGLIEGVNTLTARWGEASQTLTITNHSIGGPVFSGPQLQPWVCNTQDSGLGSAIDPQCNAATRITYHYQSTNKPAGDYSPYNPSEPPDDVATTITDEGISVPYIIRVEFGTINRSIYTLAVLADPSQPWEPWAAQNGWNGKVFIPFGGGCGTPYRQLPPNTKGNSLTGEQDVMLHKFLSRGWMGTTSGLNAFGQNCNEVVSAEAVMMLKEYIEEQFGPIRHTIGRGGSGGSIQQNNIAAAYPGLLDGITTDSTFPDAWTTFTDSTDCHLLNRYFWLRSPLRWMSPSRQAAVMGKVGISTCLSWSLLFGDLGSPTGKAGFGMGIARPGCDLPKNQVYHPDKNPSGARCSIQDYQAAIWGKKPQGNNAPLPIDNVGVQYGFNALNEGIITPQEFIDLNKSIGGLNADWEFTPDRMSIDIMTATTLYRTSRHSDPRQLAKVPIIDIRENDNSGDIHQPYMSWVMRARLDAVNGHHQNQVIWQHGGEKLRDEAVFAVDRWLMAVAADTRELPLEQKIIENRPDDVTDTCWIEGQPTRDEVQCRKAYPFSGDPRMAAGAPLRNHIRKCQLKPLNRDEYQVEFTAEEWLQLRAIFTKGVCDWNTDPVGYQASSPWISYSAGPGGQPIGTAPESVGVARSTSP